MSDETAVTTFEAVNDKILALKHRLIRLREIDVELYPDDADLLAEIPDPTGIDLSKLDEAWFTTDNCATARKVQRLAEEDLNCCGQNCGHHLRATWTNAMEKETNKFLTPIVRTSLDEYDP